jgi:hypothetical protein
MVALQLGGMLLAFGPVMSSIKVGLEVGPALVCWWCIEPVVAIVKTYTGFVYYRVRGINNLLICVRPCCQLWHTPVFL